MVRRKAKQNMIFSGLIKNFSYHFHKTMNFHSLWIRKTNTNSNISEFLFQKSLSFRISKYKDNSFLLRNFTYSASSLPFGWWKFLKPLSLIAKVEKTLFEFAKVRKQSVKDQWMNEVYDTVIKIIFIFLWTPYL